MTKTDDTPALHLDALWERSDLARTGDETALVVRVHASNVPMPAASRAPLDIAIALDRSGSMHGHDKIGLVKEAVIAATHHLTDADRISLVIFDNEVNVLHELTPATGSGKARLARVLSEVEARGSTNLSGGWLTACQQLATAPHLNGTMRVQRSLVLTDGLANQGIVDPTELVEHASQLRQRGIDTTTIGVGHDFDEMLLSGMAEAGGGAFQYIADTSMLQPFFEREIGELMDIVAVRPVLSITFPEGVRGRLVNAFPVDRHGKTVRVDLRNLARDEEVALVFDITVRDGAHQDDLSPMVELEWVHPQTGKRVAIHQELPAVRLVDEVTARLAPRNDEAAGIVALERAARDQREAVRLDREGRHVESRQRFRRSADLLAQAPQTVAVMSEHAVAYKLSMADATPLDEHTRKQRVFETHSRSRGRRKE